MHRGTPSWNGWILLVPLLFIFLPPPHTIAGEEIGAIEGMVTDDRGIPMPGATIRISSEALPKSLRAVTDLDGRYRVEGLPPSPDYKIRSEMDGFKTITETDVRVVAGEDSRIDFEMVEHDPGGIVVINDPCVPLIDFHAMVVSETVDKNLLDELPNGRSFLDAVSLLPGVAGLEEPFRRADDNHRHNFGEYSLFHVHGADCTDNVFLVDGLETTDTATGRSGLAIPWEAIQEIELVTGGMPAEYGRATGGIVNIVTRYGGNAFHGSLPVSFSGDGWHRSTDNGFRHGDHPDQPWEPSERDDFTELEWGGSLGGPVVRNHLWFFAAYDRFTRTIDDSNEYGNLFERTERFDEGLANLVWQINPDHKLKAQYAGSDGVWDSRDRYHSFYNDPTTWSRIESGGHLWQLKWTGIFTPDLFVETQVGRHENTWTDGPANAGFDDPRFWDSRGTYGSGILYGNVDEILDIHRPRDQYRATVNYFLDDRAGDHSFKAGVEYHDLEFETDLIYPDLYGINRAGGHPDYWEQGADINYLDTGKILTLFVQDKWWLNDDWIINAGLRLENQEQQNDVGEEVYSFDNLLSPRLGVVWDIHGDGRSNLFAHYGRYHDAVGLMLASALNRQVNRWYYYEGDYETGQWEEREEYRQVGDPNLNEVDPGLEPNVKDEIIVGYEFEFAGDFAARARLVCNRQSNMIEDVLANEYDIRYGNIFPHEYIRRFTNVQSARRDYRGLELVCEKQLSNNYQFLASATFSRAKGSVVYDDFHQGLGIRGVSVYADFAEMKENRYGSLPWDDAAYLKFAGSYHLPFGFIVGGTINWRSGRPYNRIDYWLPEGAEGFHGYGGQYFLEHRGYERLDSVWWIDLRLRKDFDIGPTTLSLTADAFNLTNNQDVIGVSEYYSSSGQYPISYGEPNTWMRAGYFVAGARFSF